MVGSRVNGFGVMRRGPLRHHDRAKLEIKADMTQVPILEVVGVPGWKYQSPIAGGVSLRFEANSER